MKEIRTVTIEKKRVCVRVKQNGAKFVIQPGLELMKAYTVLRELEPGEMVVDQYGDVAIPEGKFMITTESIAPYHLVTDMF